MWYCYKSVINEKTYEQETFLILLNLININNV